MDFRFAAVGPRDGAWSPWQSLGPDLRFSQRVLQELWEGGQTFQWERVEWESSDRNAGWIGILSGYLVGLRWMPGGEVQYASWNAAERAGIRPLLEQFFRLNEAHQSYLETLPLGSDSYLARCVQMFPGLRILKQPIEKVALTFLCSSNKQIPQIKQMLKALSREIGEPVAPGWWEYPSWSALAAADLETLQHCRTGYRSKYLWGSARILAEETDFFPRLRAMSYADARLELMRLPGVGEKVADCILLYGGGYYQAFPLDTWILKALEHRYQMSGLSRNAMQAWAHAHFGAYAGLAQQFLFAYEREVRELTKGPGKG